MVKFHSSHTAAASILALSFAFADSSDGAILADQIDTAYADFSTSQTFEPAFAAYNGVSADNFTFAGGVNLTGLEAVFFPNAGVNIANVSNWIVNIYSSTAAGSASLTGDVGSFTIPAASATIAPFASVQANTSLISVPFNSTLSSGTYYIGMTAQLNFGGGAGFGQTFVAASSSSTGNFGQDAFFFNPANGFGLGSSSNLSRDLSYRILGNAVPEPGATTLLAFACTAGALWRRRTSGGNPAARA